MSKWIHNQTGAERTYVGVPIADESFYEIPPAMVASYQTCSALLVDLAAGTAKMSANGTDDIFGDTSRHIAFLLGNDLSPIDSDGSPIQRSKVTQSGWRYDPRSIDWVTSKRASLYNKKPTAYTIAGQTDIGDAVIKFFDAAGAELVQGGGESDGDFQTRLAANCTATAVEWQPTYDIDVIGAKITVRGAPTTDTYFWALVAPDIPEIYGGRLTFGNGGFNLSHMNTNDKIEINGRGAKLIVYDPVYNTNKFQFLCVHEVGAQIGIQLFFEHFHG